jgi:hypothetical protein
MMFIIRRIKNWYNSQTKDGQISVWLLLGFVLVVIGYIEVKNIRLHKLKSKGVYYAARIYEISSSKNGAHYYFEYTYKGKRYTGDFKPDFHYQPDREGAYIYIQLLPDDPSVCKPLDEGEVLDNELKTMPAAGWRTLPDVPRQYLLEGNYIRYDN